MSPATTIALGAIAGLTIFIGLPVGRARNLSRRVQGLLNAASTGILLFLFWDVLTKADQPLQAALSDLHQGRSAVFASLLAVFLLGLALGLLGLVYFNAWFRDRMPGRRVPGPGGAAAETSLPSGRSLALMIATGLGLHNLSEGLAIGQAAASGSIAFAGILVVGFGLHNIAEGFGIAAPMASEPDAPTWRFLALAGAVGGAPTFFGTVIGYSFTSTYAFVLFLTLAAGALIYVINEMVAVSRRLGGAAVTGWGIILGFAAGYLTDLFLTYGGA